MQGCNGTIVAASMCLQVSALAHGTFITLKKSPNSVNDVDQLQNRHSQIIICPFFPTREAEVGGESSQHLNEGPLAYKI